ncbi:MAG: F0F1 ATP synthase subunit A [Bacteroidales bacterium]|nr:F0F1 ATP synthase subunit A [Bacteroidales bacterium]
MKFSKYLSAFLLSISIFVFNVHANEQETQENELDVNSLIMHHIMDSHEWHIISYEKNGEEKHVNIPLPIILFCDGHLDIFMSSKFHNENSLVKRGDREYIIHDDKIYLANNGELNFEEKEGELVITNKKPLDFSITRNVASLFLSIGLLLWIFLSVARAYKKRPGRPAGLQAFMEPIILFVRNDIAIPNIGEEKHKRYLPYLLSLFFFILLNNLLGLIPFFPGGSNLTGNIAVTLTLAIFTLVLTTFSGNKNYWKHIFATPGVPIWLYPIMIPVELIGILTKPFALMIRLFANITAGHIIIISLVSMIFLFKTALASFVVIPFVLFMNVLELLVAFLQAYIFTMLTALFVGLAVQDGDEH